jgi:hypothetical protein
LRLIGGDEFGGNVAKTDSGAARDIRAPARLDAGALDPKGIPLTAVGLNNRREVTVFFRPEPWLAQLLGVAGRFGGSTVRSPSFPRFAISRPLSWELHSQNLNPFDFGRFGKQFGCLSHESLGDWTAQMSLASTLVGKRIEYPESCRPQPQREPQRRCHFFVGQGKSCFQELRNLIFLPGFCFQAREQCNCKHRFLLG